MRKSLATIIAAATALPAAAVLATASPAAADNCPAGQGSVPGTAPRIVTVGPFYVDDRQYHDWEDDDRNGGIWLYYETGVKSGLQRGGDQFIFTTMSNVGVSPTVPRIDKIQPVPGGPSLFPNGWGGGSLAETAGSHDDCFEGTKAQRDMIIF